MRRKWLLSFACFLGLSRVGFSAIVFDFQYGSGSEYWSLEARTALSSAAQSLASYFPGASATLTFTVIGENEDSGTLASAGSNVIDTGAGFHRTIVQNKIISGIDSNSSDPDGEIRWNFFHNWDYGDEVDPDAYDFHSTAMHELMHTLGFLSYLQAPGGNTGTFRPVYDSFITDKNGLSPFDPVTFEWNTSFNSILTGGSANGLFFSGPNAMAAYGGQRVPLFSPDAWEQGSSASHLDDNTFTGIQQKLMNAALETGPGVRVLSQLELAILSDLSYVVVPEPTIVTLLALALALVVVHRVRGRRPWLQ